ncbi:hypothetical protein BDC45DRAFT_501208 [Circinella umbellata]|nr:hypothetical protein BDC45DRAFT_501208 [Circinella umbellata]
MLVHRKRCCCFCFYLINITNQIKSNKKLRLTFFGLTTLVLIHFSIHPLSFSFIYSFFFLSLPHPHPPPKNKKCNPHEFLAFTVMVNRAPILPVSVFSFFISSLSTCWLLVIDLMYSAHRFVLLFFFYSFHIYNIQLRHTVLLTNRVLVFKTLLFYFSAGFDHFLHLSPFALSCCIYYTAVPLNNLK